MTATTNVATTPARYTAARPGDELLAEGLQCITSGRPLPESLRPVAPAMPAGGLEETLRARCG